MLKLNVGSFVKNLSAAEAYIPPHESNEGDKGVKYLYEKLYLPLADNAEVLIGSIDLNAFTLEEIGNFETYFDNTVSLHKNKADYVRHNLYKLTPAVSKTKFI